MRQSGFFCNIDDAPFPAFWLPATAYSLTRVDTLPQCHPSPPRSFHSSLPSTSPFLLGKKSQLFFFHHQKKKHRQEDSVSPRRRRRRFLTCSSASAHALADGYFKRTAPSHRHSTLIPYRQFCHDFLRIKFIQSVSYREGLLATSYWRHLPLLCGSPAIAHHPPPQTCLSSTKRAESTSSAMLRVANSSSSTARDCCSTV